MTKDMNFSERLRLAYEAKGLTVTQLAKLVHVSQPTVTAWLNGTHRMREENARVVARALGKSAAWILFGVDYDGETSIETGDELAVLRFYRGANSEGKAAILAMSRTIHRQTYTGQ